ncbi:MAG: hypothetical protein Q9226_007615, partial [Calogaya cf. arnoldii]
YPFDPRIQELRSQITQLEALLAMAEVEKKDQKTSDCDLTATYEALSGKIAELVDLQYELAGISDYMDGEVPLPTYTMGCSAAPLPFQTPHQNISSHPPSAGYQTMPEDRVACEQHGQGLVGMNSSSISFTSWLTLNPVRREARGIDGCTSLLWLVPRYNVTTLVTEKGR